MTSAEALLPPHLLPPLLAPQPFTPPALLRGTSLQTILASRHPRVRSARISAVTQVARLLTLDGGDGVRLQAWHSAQPAAPAGLLVLIHGWEGSHESTYVLGLADGAYRAGWNVLRLNLRDHGGTYHLNHQFFNSARIAEVIGAIRAASALDAAQPLVVAGYSLGGNFALRTGLHGPAAGLRPELCIGICPVMNPDATMHAIDRGARLFRWYFARRWQNSLLAKAAAWPGHFPLDEHLPVRGMVRGTELFVRDFTEFGSYQAYVQAYGLQPQALMASPTPLAVVTAQDDPIIPFADFAGLRAEGAVRAWIASERGGHCGFVDQLHGPSWAERCVLAWLAQVQTEARTAG